jgi:AAA family ATP:ADP antiporter
MGEAAISLGDVRERGALDRFLSLFSVVRGGEGVGAILLAANVFLLLAGYYVLKTVREPLILQQGRCCSCWWSPFSACWRHG